MRKGLFFGSAMMVIVTGGAFVAYLMAPVRHAVSGYIMNADGRPVAKAEVAITPEHGPTGVPRSLVTNADGWFSFPELTAGTFKVRAKAPGGASAERGGLKPGDQVMIEIPAK